MKLFWLTFLSVLFIGCGDPKLNYKCTCIQIAYSANEDGTNVDLSFSENVCDTYENIETSFEQGGGIYKGLQTCEEEMSALSDEFECECDCFYQSEC